VLPGSYDPSKGGKMGGPTIPKRGDEYDYEALTKKISEVKDAFPDETKIIITAEQHIKYEVLIKTMDATREANGRMLFPDVVLSAGVT
jgi:biopolymer transport protein ExbD